MHYRSAALYIRSDQTNSTYSPTQLPYQSKFDISPNLKNPQNRVIIYIEIKGKERKIPHFGEGFTTTFSSPLFPIPLEERDIENLTFCENGGIIYIEKRKRDKLFSSSWSLISGYVVMDADRYDGCGRPVIVREETTHNLTFLENYDIIYIEKREKDF